MKMACTEITYEVVFDWSTSVLPLGKKLPLQCSPKKPRCNSRFKSQYQPRWERPRVILDSAAITVSIGE